MAEKNAELDSKDRKGDGRNADSSLDGPDTPESRKRSDLKKIREQCELDELQAVRGGLKVKDSDFKTG